jgi:hypothetical protein
MASREWGSDLPLFAISLLAIRHRQGAFMTTPKSGRVTSRRRFLAGAAIGGAAALAAPRMSRAESVAPRGPGAGGAKPIEPLVREFTVGQTKAANLYGHSLLVPIIPKA